VHQKRAGALFKVCGYTAPPAEWVQPKKAWDYVIIAPYKGAAHASCVGGTLMDANSKTGCSWILQPELNYEVYTSLYIP
jgi:hypothetical protein